MRTIDLKIEMNYTEAVQYLLDGKCVGIRPKGNTNFLVKYKPSWMNPKSNDYILCWNRSVINGKGDESIRSNQILGVWYPVVVDSNHLPNALMESLRLKDVFSSTELPTESTFTSKSKLIDCLKENIYNLFVDRGDRNCGVRNYERLNDADYSDIADKILDYYSL